jgi:ribonuclease R
MMTAVADRPDHEMLQTMLLRSMKQAIYDPENRGHFGLALQAYAHFTSPIRRYPDLSLHRAIKYLLAKRDGEVNGRTTETGGWHAEMAEMLQLGQQSSMSERRADEATRDVADWLKCDFMQDHVGEVFSGIIASVTGFGFFVRLNDLFIDGLVHVSTLDNDYYRYDNIGQRLIGESGGKVYRLGDIVEIRVEAVHMDERKMDFSLVSSHRQPRGAGKTERSRTKQQASHGADGETKTSRRRSSKKPANFEPDSAFRSNDQKDTKAAKVKSQPAKGRTKAKPASSSVSAEGASTANETAKPRRSRRKTSAKNKQG